jgi:hypothetical protein
MYIDFETYRELGGVIDDETKFNKVRRQVERQVDILTFNRSRTLDLSAYEKGILEEVCQEMIDFEDTNAEYINSFVSDYSLNGVSISFSNVNKNISYIAGICIPTNTYQKLLSTRLGSKCL